MKLTAQILTLRSMFVAMASVQLVTAASNTMVALYFAETGASQEAAALAPSLYSLGFLVGCFYVSGAIASVGYIRSYAAAGSICIASVLLFALSEFVPALLAVRFATGVATAALYAIGDAWIGEAAHSKTRGSLLAVYAIVLGIMSFASQILIQVLPDDLNEGFVIISLLYCVATVVLLTTRIDPPSSGSGASVRLATLFGDAPAAFVGAFVAGMVATTLLTVMPYRASVLGIDAKDIALAVGAIYLGRILLMYPLGRASDGNDRRVIIVVTSALACVLLIGFATLTSGDGDTYRAAQGTYLQWTMLASLVLLGGALLTLYSLCAAHALDRSPPAGVASASVSMLFVTTLGGVAGPLLASAVSGVLGDPAVTWLLAGLMAILTAFTAQRLRRRESASRAQKTTYVAVEPTSVEAVPEDKTKA